jgi:hypothetical protein
VTMIFLTPSCSGLSESRHKTIAIAIDHGTVTLN